MSTTRPCRRCSRVMLLASTGPAGALLHAGRDLCGSCWSWAHDHNALHLYPRRNRSSTDVLIEYRSLRALHPDWSNARIASAIGVTYPALRKTLSRASRSAQRASTLA